MLENWIERLNGQTEAKPARKRVAEVGWLLQTEKAGFIWEAPQQFSRRDGPPTSTKAVQMCPAVLDFEARTFVVPCPIDLHLRFRYDDKGQPQLINAAGQRSNIRNKHLRQMVSVSSRNEWRHPERPVIQIVTPYTFVADEPVIMSQTPPFLHFREPALPGVMIAGRLPIDVWPRQMMWAFDWHRPDQDIVLKRGEPWFYVRFETEDPTRQVRLVEAEYTQELKDYFEGMAGVTNYVNRTFSLFSTARERRPETLLVKKQV